MATDTEEGRGEVGGGGVRKGGACGRFMVWGPAPSSDTNFSLVCVNDGRE